MSLIISCNALTYIYTCVLSHVCGEPAKSQHTFLASKPFVCLWCSFRCIAFIFLFSCWLQFFSLYLSLIVCFPFHSTLWMRAFRTQMPIYICYSFDSVLVFVFLQRAWNWTIFKQFVLICINSCDHTVGIAIAVYQPTHLAELIWSYIYAHIFTYISGISWSRLFVLLLSHCAAYKHNF